jgi:hypothetical protein
MPACRSEPARDRSGIPIRFDDLARVHDGDARRHARDHAEIVADVHHRHPGARTDVLEQVEDHRLGRCIQIGRRLIENHQIRLEGEGDRDGDALPLPAAQLVGIAARDVASLRKLDGAKDCGNRRSRFGGRRVPVLANRLRNLFAHPHRRRQRCQRILMDHRNAAAPDLPQLRRRRPQQRGFRRK